jgi:hypothetical protein
MYAAGLGVRARILIVVRLSPPSWGRGGAVLNRWVAVTANAEKVSNGGEEAPCHSTIR